MLGVLLVCIVIFCIVLAIAGYEGAFYLRDAKHQKAEQQPVSLKELEQLIEFDWLKEYGGLWEPGSTAFWLEPDTCDQLASWQCKYRPNEYGRIIANDDVRIDWIEPIRQPLPNYQHFKELTDAQAIRQMSLMEQSNYFYNNPMANYYKGRRI